MSKYYYFTTDSLNAVTAEQLAERKGLTIEVVDPRDLSRLEHEQAELILDWDYIPDEERKFLLSSAAVNVVGVHGFNLSESLERFLSRRSIVFSSRLDEDFIDILDEQTRAAYSVLDRRHVGPRSGFVIVSECASCFFVLALHPNRFLPSSSTPLHRQASNGLAVAMHSCLSELQ